MSEIINKIQNTVDRYGMLSNGDTVAVGVSGGADSMLLLHFLIGVREKYNLKLIVCNVEHGIRGEESIRDSEFVKRFCEVNDLEFRCLAINALQEAAACKMGVEEYSRKRRYKFFASQNADKIAVAHNLSDSVETVLFRIARGTSIKGLGGISAVRDNIIRPLIDLNKDEIRAYCDLNGIEYVTDSTNSDNAYSRNRIRNVIIPELQKLNTSFESAVKRLIDSSAEDEAFITCEAQKVIDSAKHLDGVKTDKLNDCALSVKKRIIAILLSAYGVSTDDLHLNEAVKLFDNSGKVQIKDNVFIASSGGYLRAYESTNEQNDFSLEYQVIGIDQYKSESHTFDAACDYDKISGDVFVRGRLDGDSISPANRHCTKTLKKLYNELKIPSEKRESIPLICDGAGIIAIPEITVDERVKLTDETRSVILFRINTED